MSLEDPLVDHPRYQTIKILGEGAYGFVVRAKDKERNEEVAIKFLSRGPAISKRVDREVLNHNRLIHPHVIEFKQLFLTDCYLAIVMEYAVGGNLREFIREKRGISEDMARWFFQQIIIGLDYIHQNGVSNRDIKLENTLLDDNPWPLVKICDFGLCKREDVDSDPHSIVGSPQYLAPEIISRNDPQTEAYDGKKADIWSCGVLLYAMLVRRYPFDRPDEEGARHTEAIHERIIRTDYQIPRGSMSNECADLIRRILVFHPKMRPDISEIQQHRWYQIRLPKHALSMNKNINPQDIQSKSEIEAILVDARSVEDSREFQSNT